MAEVLGPIGFCFGAISCILNTVPTIVEAVDTYQSAFDQIQEYKIRLANSESKMNRWDIFWRNSGPGGHQNLLLGTRKSMEQIKNDIQREVDKYVSEDSSDRPLWKRIKSRLRHGGRLKQKAVSIGQSLGYTLYNKRLLEGWVGRLEKMADGLETLSKNELGRRTAEHSNDNPTLWEIRRIGELEKFSESLNNLAEALYTTCDETPHTTGWALGLRPPDKLKGVEYWSRTQINIELLFSTNINQIPQERHLNVQHNRSREVETQLPSHQAIRDRSHIRPAVIRRTPPLGEIFLTNYFEEDEMKNAWRKDRARLLLALSHWVPLLWNTAWIKGLCSHGLQFEKGSSGQDCVMQTFTAKLHKDGHCSHRDSRLRNLGLILTELALATPVRYHNYGNGNEFDLWENGDWKMGGVAEATLLELVGDATNANQVCDVIEFCLNDPSALATGTYLPGFLLKCIDKIYKPIKEWYGEEVLVTYAREETWAEGTFRMLQNQPPHQQQPQQQPEQQPQQEHQNIAHHITQPALQEMAHIDLPIEHREAAQPTLPGEALVEEGVPA